MKGMHNYLFVVCFLAISHFIHGQDKRIAQFVINAGNSDRYDTPVSVSLEGVSYNTGERYSFREVTNENPEEISFQVEKGLNSRIWWILKGRTPKGAERIFELYRAEPEHKFEDEVKFGKNDTSLILFKNNNAVLQYNHALTAPPEGTSELYTRSAYIHPLYSPDGFMLTAIHPDDHIHHMGIWNPWTKTLFEGREIDFWNLYKGEGTVKFAHYISNYDGPVFSGFKALHEHIDLMAPTYKGSKVALNEVWDVRLYNSGEGYSIIDFISTLNCASDSSVTMKEYRYAGFGYRANPFWTNKNSNVLTSEGKTRKDADATRARWCDVSGLTPENDRAGILFMSHTANYNHPEPMRVWPIDANNGRGDVFFQFCPIRDRDWHLNPGREYVLKYRMYIYDGEITSEKAEQLWQDFTNPPKITVKSQ